MTTATDGIIEESIQPLGEGRVQLTFTAGAELVELLQRARRLLYEECPQGHLSCVISEALLELLRLNDDDWDRRMFEDLGRA